MSFLDSCFRSFIVIPSELVCNKKKKANETKTSNHRWYFDPVWVLLESSHESIPRLIFESFSPVYQETFQWFAWDPNQLSLVPSFPSPDNRKEKEEESKWKRRVSNRIRHYFLSHFVQSPAWKTRSKSVILFSKTTEYNMSIDSLLPPVIDALIQYYPGLPVSLFHPLKRGGKGWKSRQDTN